MAHRPRFLTLVGVLAITWSASACGGSSDGESSAEQGVPSAATGGGGTDEAAGAPVATVAVATASGEVVDPAQVDGCSILTLDEVSAATGATASNPVNYSAGSTVVSECNYTLGTSDIVAFQIDLQVPPGSRSLSDARTFDVGTGGQVTDSGGLPLAITDINGWLVTLTVLNGAVTEQQLAGLGRLLEARIAPRPGSGGAGGTPTGTPTAGAEGSCSVEVTGAIVDSFTSGQDTGEAYVAAWVSEAEREAAEAMFPGGGPDFQVGCSGEAGQSVLISLAGVDVPLGSTSVTVPDNEAGYYSSNGIVGNDGPVEIVLTTLDETRLAGSVTFTGDGLGSGTSTVTMTFDFVNTFGS